MQTKPFIIALILAILIFDVYFFSPLFFAAMKKDEPGVRTLANVPRTNLVATPDTRPTRIVEKCLDSKEGVYLNVGCEKGGSSHFPSIRAPRRSDH